MKHPLFGRSEQGNSRSDADKPTAHALYDALESGASYFRESGPDRAMTLSLAISARRSADALERLGEYFAPSVTLSHPVPDDFAPDDFWITREDADWYSWKELHHSTPIEVLLVENAQFQKMPLGDAIEWSTGGGFLKASIAGWRAVIR